MTQKSVSATRGLNVRQIPSLVGQIVAVLPHRTIVTTTDEMPILGSGILWTRISNPHDGFVATMFLQDIPTNVLTGLQLGAPFKVPFVLTSQFLAPRSYKGKRHEGADFDILTQQIDSKEPVLALFDGIVIRSVRSSGAYGEFVIQQCFHNNGTFNLWYCHMDERFVFEGQSVKQGQPVGELGGTGGFPEHIHLNLQVPGFGMQGLVVPDVVDPVPFISNTPAEMIT